MNTLRTLPILNRPSRPSTPGPASTQTSNTTATAQPPSVGVFATASEPGKPRAKSLQRQVADKVSSLHVSNHASHNASISPSQPVGGKKGVSPPVSRAATPRSSSVNLTPQLTGETAPHPQSGYMEVVGLRLNESVNKACYGVDLKARKGFKKGTGWSVGEAVVKELPNPPSDAYLIRAILRTSVRSLSIYLTRLESLLLPALTDPAFMSPLNLHPPSALHHPLNPVQYFAISVAHAAWETCEVLEQTLETGKWPKFVSDTLRPIMDKFDLIVGKVVQPLLMTLKRDLIAALNRTEGVSPSGGKVLAIPSLPAPTSAVSKHDTGVNGPMKLTKEISSGGSSRQLPIPTCFQQFASNIDGARKIFELVTKPCGDDGEGWVTGIVVSLIWKGMCQVAERDLGAHPHRPPSPASVTKALNNLALKESGNHGASRANNSHAAHSHPIHANTMPPPAITPSSSASMGGVTAKLTTMLPRTASRPPSPPRQSTRWDPATHALISLEGLIKRLVHGLVGPPEPETSTATSSAPEHIAREALHEAIEALVSLKTICQAAHSGKHPSERLLGSARRIRDDIDDEAEEALDDAVEDAPAPLLLSAILRQANHALASIPTHVTSKPPADTEKAKSAPLVIRHPAEVWGWSTAEYERQVLGGFGSAEEWRQRVALALKPDIERVMSELAQNVATTTLSSGQLGSSEKSGSGEKAQSGAAKSHREVIVAVEWIKCLGVLCDARAGVRVPSAS